MDTLTCSPVRWNKRGFGDPQVYFRDSSGSAWPVSASVTEWNRAVGADSYYIWHANGPCPAASTGKHCVPVTSAYYGSNWIGRIQYSADANRYFIDGTVKVFLNSSHGPGRGLPQRGVRAARSHAGHRAQRRFQQLHVLDQGARPGCALSATATTSA